MMIWVVRVICSIEVLGVWLIDVLGLLLGLLTCDDPGWCFRVIGAPDITARDPNISRARGERGTRVRGGTKWSSLGARRAKRDADRPELTPGQSSVQAIGPHR